jgi:hypothetical protein
MGDRQLGTVLQFLRRLADPDTTAGLSDGQLLRRFIDGRDQAAFAALVGRHGRLVLAVCRRLLPTLPDAEDAFQARSSASPPGTAPRWATCLWPGMPGSSCG